MAVRSVVLNLAELSRLKARRGCRIYKASKDHLIRAIASLAMVGEYQSYLRPGILPTRLKQQTSAVQTSESSRRHNFQYLTPHKTAKTRMCLLAFQEEADAGAARGDTAATIFSTGSDLRRWLIHSILVRACGT